jgi:hypothetical protein
MQPMLLLKSLGKHSDVCVDRDPFIIGRTSGCQVNDVILFGMPYADFDGELYSPVYKTGL